MYDMTELKEYMRSKKYDFVTHISYRSGDDVLVLYVPKDKIGKTAENGMTSRRQIKSIEKQINTKFGKDVSTVFMQSEADRDLERGLFRILNLKFGNRIESIHIQRTEDHYTLDIKAKDFDQKLRSRAEKHLKSFLDNMSLSIRWGGAESRQPSLPALLRIIKVHQPISLEKMMDRLEGKYTVTGAWLRSRLDSARKKGFVHWDKSNGCYELTSKGLDAVPSGARRSSSDVDRALAWRGKKW